MFDYLKRILEQIREISSGIDDYQKLSPSGAMPAVAQVNKALLLIKDKKIDDAESVLMEAEQVFPPNEGIYKTLGYIYEIKRDFPNVIKYLKKAYQLNSIKKDTIMRLGYAELSDARYNDALETFEKATKLFPLDSETISAHGMALYKLGQFEDARNDFMKAFSLDSHNLNALFLCANVDVILGDYAKAEPRLALLIKVAPITIHLYEYANLKRLKKEYDEALKYAQQIIDKNKNFLPAYLLMAEVYLENKEHAKAKQSIKNAESNELYSDLLYLTKANVYIATDDFEIAKEAYEKAIDFGVTDDVLIGKILACNLMSAEENNLTDEVIAYTQDTENEKIADKKALKYLILGIWNYKEKNLEHAEDFLRKAINITEQPPFAYHLLAKIYVATDDEYRAEKYFNIVMEKNPKNFEATKDYVDFLISKERYEDAKYKSKNALKIFVNNYYFENMLFISEYKLLNNDFDEFNVKELIKLAEKLEKNSSFMYHNEKKILVENLENNKRG